MKNWNQKKKAEQLFVLSLIFITLFSWLCITGCGGRTCETPKFGTGNLYKINATGLSIPGCGGCITPRKGCDTWLWAQSCKFVSVSDMEEGENSNYETDFKGCDIRFYGGGCLGCGQQEKSCYSGCIKMDSDVEKEKMNGIIYGSSDNGEKYIGFAGGCGGCIGSEGIGRALIQEIELLTGVE